MNDKQLLEFVDNYLQLLEKKTSKYDDHPALKGGQKNKLPDSLQKAIINKKTKNESENSDIVSEKQKDSSHLKQYKAPEGSERDRLLDKAKELYKKGKKKQAQKIRDRMEKSARSEPGFKSRKSKYTEAYLVQELKFLLSEAEAIIDEGFSKKTKTAIRNKAEKHNAPYGALATVYRKGLGAYTSSGSRPGMSAAQWAMARVNSFLKGGKARQVDSAQWEKVKTYRKKNKGKKRKK